MPITQEALTRLSRGIGLFFRVIGLGNVIGSRSALADTVRVRDLICNQSDSLCHLCLELGPMTATGYEPVTRPGINRETTEVRSKLLILVFTTTTFFYWNRMEMHLLQTFFPQYISTGWSLTRRWWVNIEQKIKIGYHWELNWSFVLAGDVT